MYLCSWTFMKVRYILNTAYYPTPELQREYVATLQ